MREWIADRLLAVHGPMTWSRWGVIRRASWRIEWVERAVRGSSPGD